ncbi:MAG: MerR family transcriptional regulator, partial [Bdellovibrionales bacterium]|nr:MerR family transcriptional regulator [Bdellovibrionales bacterium]
MLDTKLPEKSLFRVDEVCSIAGIKSYVLRFWEAEFTEINPIISASGKKMYEPKDIYILSLIKKLLFEDKLTIEKAKAQLCSMDLDNLNENSSMETVEDNQVSHMHAAKKELEKLVSLTDSVK